MQFGIGLLQEVGDYVGALGPWCDAAAGVFVPSLLLVPFFLGYPALKRRASPLGDSC
jgi:hypothetical protein